MKPLVVIPTYLTEPEDVETVRTAIDSVRKTEHDAVDILVVDDGSPERELVGLLEAQSSQLKFDLHRKDENSGFSKTVNVGLRRCLEEDRDAILLNADMEITTPNWLGHFRATTGSDGDLASVVGAMLLYPDGTIQHAGVYFSLLTRTFDHRYKHGPANLPEALRKEVCPVTAAFMFIRHDCLAEVGIYDEDFKMGWEDVDYCIRTFLAGRQCVYNPNVRGFHYEMKFRGRPNPKIKDWQDQSFVYLIMKYQNQSFADFVPFV